MQNQFLLLKDGVGLSEWQWETGHPWEQRHSWGHECWEKTQALLQVIDRFIVGCVLRQGAGLANGEDAPPKCDRLQPHDARFSQ